VEWSFGPSEEDTMRQSWLRTLGGAVLVAAIALTYVPGAHAQGMVRPGGVFGGYQTGGYYGAPYGGMNQGFGYGNYPGGYANYDYGNLGYYPGNPVYGGYQNFQSPTYYGRSMIGNSETLQGYYNPPLPTGTFYPPNVNTLTGVMGFLPPAQQPTPNTTLFTIRLPADAKFMVDDAATNEIGPVRQFVTPGTLEKGKTYHYNLKAQWTENGQPVTRERKVDFQAGGQVNVNFNSGSEQ
jgi:uncharacterized protein (TIGR03000 family)